MAVEFVLIAGLVLLMVIAAVPTLQKQAELNKALAAARDGATFSASLRALGYSTPHIPLENRNPPGVIKIRDVSIVSKGVDEATGKKKYQIRIKADAPMYLSEYEDTIEASIRNHARSYVYYAFHGEYQPGFASVSTGYYRFTFAANLTIN